jgi:hypothetical protein
LSRIAESEGTESDGKHADITLLLLHLRWLQALPQVSVRRMDVTIIGLMIGFHPHPPLPMDLYLWTPPLVIVP